MKKIILLLPLFLIAVPAFPCWDQFQKDAKHTGSICDVTIDTPLCIKYRYPVPGGMLEGGSPLTDDEGFVYTNGQYSISKFDPKTGNYVWVQDGYSTIDAPGMLIRNEGAHHGALSPLGLG